MEEKKPLLKFDASIFEHNSTKEFSSFLKNNKEKTVKAFVFFVDGIKSEATDSKETRRIIYKSVTKEKITKEEELHLKTRVYDIFKKVGIGIPFMLIPGAVLLIPFILKVADKRGIDLYPANFKGKTNLEIIKNEEVK